MMEPLLVTAELRSPVAGAADLPLDGILSAAWMRINHPDVYWSSTPIGRIENLIEAELPVERRGDGGEWYWAASFAAWSDASDALQFWNKRLDHKEVSRVEFERRGNIDIAAGRYKAYHMPVPTRSALSITWRAVGIKHEIEVLLNTILNLGKKRSQGYGKVDRWTVQPMQEDHSCWWNGRPMRTIPMGDKIIDELSIGLRTYRPPYWLNERRALCYIPE